MAKIFLTLITVSFLSSCSLGQSLVSVMGGNFYFNRGDYGKAIIRYIKAGENLKPINWLNYNLGNVYYALGEVDAALDKLIDASQSGDEILYHRTHFNIGVIYFEMGQYERAVIHFIDALDAVPGDRDTKINLELALQKLGREETVSRQSDSIEDDQESSLKFHALRLLDYIYDQEEKSWGTVTESPDAAGEDW